MSGRPAATGFVLAGGESRRMGRDKALLPWRGTTLLDHALERLTACCREVRILCGPRLRYQDRGVPVHVDGWHGAGPLAGLAAGLAVLGSDPGLFLAVDLPAVPVELLARLLEWADGHDAAVPVAAGGPQPLCAVYRASCLPAVERRLASGDFKMTSFWPDVRVRQVTEEELAAFGPAADVFRNINEPSDLTP